MREISWAFVNGPPVHHGVLTRILESKHDLGESTPFTRWLRFIFCCVKCLIPILITGEGHDISEIDLLTSFQQEKINHHQQVQV